MTGNRYPKVPNKIIKEYSKISKSDIIETLYDLSELQTLNEDERCNWVLKQIKSRQLANKK